MKRIILIWFILTGWFIAIVPAQPAPRRIDLSGVTEADIEATVLHEAQLVRDAEEKVRAANVATDAAKVDVEKLQGVVENLKADNTKLQAKVGPLQTFARVVLGLVFAATALAAWRLTAGFAFPAPWGWAFRLALCLAAGGIASGLVWRIITHLL